MAYLSVMRQVARRPALPVLLALAGLLLFAAAPRPAAAHANLVRSDPAAGSVLATAPPQVQLWFSEEPDPHFSEVQVLDAGRQRVDTGATHPAAGDPLSLVAALKPLPNGLYTVSWKTVSAVDGHVVNGSFPFYVGPPQGTAVSVVTSAGPPATSSVDAGAVAARWLSLLSAIVLLGGFSFALLVLSPAWSAALTPGGGPGAMAAPATLRERTPALPGAIDHRRRMLLVGAWALLAVADIVALVQNARASSGVGIVAALGAPLQTVLLHTRFGQTWWLRAGATLLAGAALAAWLRPGAARATRRGAALTGMLAIEGVFLAYSLNSHGAALRSGSTLATASDLLHLSATGLWLGGLAQFLLLLPVILRRLDETQRLRLLAAAVPRFSTLALFAVVTLLATGVYQSYRQLPGWQALWESGYGRTLSVKLLLIVPLLLLGAWNLLVLRRALAAAAGVGSAGTGTMPRLALRRFMPAARTLERTFLRIVAAETVLGLLIIGVVGLLLNQAPPQAAAAPTGGLHLTAKAENVEVQLGVTPGTVGLNHFEAVVKRGGKPPPDGTRLVLRLTYQDADMGTSELPTTARGGGRYDADSSDLSTIGRWQILALVQPPAADEVRTEFALSISAGGASGTGQTATGDSSVARGRQLFAANCAHCHGATGHGDGPDAKRYDPPPVDLVVHVPQHSDQQLLDWIANGIPTTAMPAFGQKLSQQERQAILNYLRTLPPATPTPTTPATGGAGAP